jgi:hypothetical protein
LNLLDSIGDPVIFFKRKKKEEKKSFTDEIEGIADHVAVQIRKVFHKRPDFAIKKKKKKKKKK